MDLAPTPETAWYLIALVAFWLVLGCLRIVGQQLETAVRWHDLGVRVHRLKGEQQRRMELMEEARAPRGPDAGVPSLTRPADVEVAEAVEIADAEPAAALAA